MYNGCLIFLINPGIFGGVRHNMQSVIFIDFVGVHRLAKAQALQNMVLTIIMALNHPVVGTSSRPIYTVVIFRNRR